MTSDLFEIKESEKAVFGSSWCGPDKFNRTDRPLIANYPKEIDSDGQSVEIYCSAGPARSYEVKVLDDKDNHKKGSVIKFGAGVGGKLAVQIAEAIQDGLIRIQ